MDFHGIVTHGVGYERCVDDGNGMSFGLQKFSMNEQLPTQAINFNSMWSGQFSTQNK